MSVQIPPTGTRGAWFPKLPGWLTERMNRMMANRLRRKGGMTTRGVTNVVLETTGAHTGALREAVVGEVPDGPDAWLIVASLSGTARHPQWLYNLAKDPEAILDFGDGRRIQVRAETPSGPDLDAAWAKIAEAAPIYVGYRSKTDREIPVVRLVVVKG